jgi:hypothetical protein
MTYFTENNLSVKVRDAIKFDPYRWHSIVGIDTDKLKTSKGSGCPFGCGGEGHDRLYKSKSFGVDGTVVCNKKCGGVHGVFDAFAAVIETGKASDFNDAVKVLADLYNITAQPKTSTGKPKTSSSKKTVTQKRSWIYENAAGTPHYKVDRVDYSDGTKDCYQSRYDTATADYVAGMNGVELVPLYLPEIVNNPEKQILITEGEKCCDAICELAHKKPHCVFCLDSNNSVLDARQYDLTSTKVVCDFGIVTTASGGSNTKLDWTKYISGNRQVFLMTDSDQPGRKYMNRVGKALAGIGCDVRYIDLYPDASDGRDLADFIKAISKNLLQNSIRVI